MEQVESHHKGILDQAFLDDWVCEEAKRFFQKYRAVGVTRLVSLLNMITDSSLDDAYSYIFYIESLPINGLQPLLYALLSMPLP